MNEPVYLVCDCGSTVLKAYGNPCPLDCVRCESPLLKVDMDRIKPQTQYETFRDNLLQMLADYPAAKDVNF